MARFEGRVALVTGARRGIGRAIAEALVRDGARVVVNAREAMQAAPVAEALGDAAVAMAADLRDPAAVDRMVAAILARFGRLDILVNNAAFATPTRLPDLGLDEWQRSLEVNLTAPFLCLKAVLPSMRKAGYGRIVNIGSTASKTVSTLAGAHYTAAKHGLLGLTRAAARELGPFGITVNMVSPGVTDTELVEETATPERIRQLEATAIPVGRIGRPAEVADLVCFVASEAAGYLNGAVLDINGGIMLC
ncbi:MAG: SDR family oxidoreductase [Gemmatimonadales bacterium]